MSINWRLNVLMAERHMKNKDLTEATGLHPVTISKLKNSHEVPERLERTTLEKLCAALNCQPGDLMIWEPEQKNTNTPYEPFQGRKNLEQEEFSPGGLRKRVGTEKPVHASNQNHLEYQEQ